MPGEGAVRNGSTKCAPASSSAASELGAFGLDRAAAEIADFGDRLGRAHVADRLAGGELLFHDPAEHRVAQRIGAGAALPRSAKPAHAVADVQKEAFALLLAIVGDIDAGCGLLGDDAAQGLVAEPVDLRRIDRFAARSANIELGQLGRARQAAGMSGQDAVFAAAHRRSFRCDCVGFSELIAEPPGVASANANKSPARTQTTRLSAGPPPHKLGSLAQQLKGGDPVCLQKPRSSAAVTRILASVEIRA